MKNLFKNLLPYKWIALLVLLLLLGQAFCDMSLPQYTQNMIDTGIQNKGIEHILPEKMTWDEFDKLKSHMDASQKKTLNKVYSIENIEGSGRSTKEYIELPETESFAVRDTELSREELNSLDSELLQPVLERYLETLNAEEQAKARETIDAELEAAGIQSRNKKQETEAISNNETLLSMGCAYAYECDMAAGIDVDSIRSKYMWTCGGMMLLMAIIMLSCTIGVSLLSARIGAKIGRDLRLKMFRNVMAFSTNEMDKFHTSSLITRATNDIQQVQMTSTMLMRMMLYAPCICLWGIVKVYQTHAHMNFIIVIGTAVLLLLLGVVMMIAVPKFKIIQSLVDGLNSVSREILTGLQVVRAFGREKTEEERFNEANRNLYDVQLFVNRTMTLLTPVMMIVMYGLTIWITWVGAHRIDRGVIQVGEMTAFISYAIMIVSSFLMIAGMFLFLPRAGVAADRIAEVITTEASILDAEDATAISPDTEGLVRFNHVSFRYPDAEENVLTDIDFEVKPGETCAIIGSTGCGKSTLIDLIPRFYDVTEGSITIDGIDLRHISLESLRRIIGYVPQKGVLFSGTIGSNIRFGKLDASDEELAEAVRIAQVEDFVNEKEDKYDSYIAQGGANVSGGQKQRLSIARAIAKKPKILIFDDSFSALDMKTDAELRKALATEAANVTKLVVAQRVGTILTADQIIVLDDGRVVGKGTHEELMKTCAVYKGIAESQLSEKELKGING